MSRTKTDDLFDQLRNRGPIPDDELEAALEAAYTDGVNTAMELVEKYARLHRMSDET